MRRVLHSVFPLTALLIAGAAWAPIQEKATTMTLKIQGKGDVVITLYTKEAPKTTAHILGLAEKGFYDGLKFFRVMKEPKPFLVLFGDPQTKTKAIDDAAIGTGGSGKRIAYEDSGKSNLKGAVGLSTLPRDKDSGDSQFYILLDDKPFLNGNYTVFGQVTSGMDVVSKVEVGDQVTSISIVRG